MDFANLEQWSAALAGLIAGIDAPDLPRRLMAALAAGVPFDGRFIAVFHKDAPPTVVHEAGPSEPARPYAHGPYLLDPYFNRYLTGPAGGGCFALHELAPDGFTRTRYFTTYYRHLNLWDEIGYILPLDAASAAHLSVSRTRAFPRFSRRDLAWFRAVTPIVREILRRVWERESQRPAARSRARSALHESLSDAFRQFGTLVLTEREVEVVRLLLRGNSAKAIARGLGISPGTARNHLKHIYPKLGVASQAELFALFFRTLEGGGDPAGDPLLPRPGALQDERAR